MQAVGGHGFTITEQVINWLDVILMELIFLVCYTVLSLQLFEWIYLCDKSKKQKFKLCHLKRTN